ncbi:MAG: 50S ribosomal protein L9 [Bacilli bacterium]|nr:50S ribosomal protein L9 [Bacilli bacterium]
MKIILIDNVKGTGKKDEIKEVKDGFASFLIKEKKAVPYSNKSKEVLDTELEDKKQKEETLIKEMTELKKRLEQMEIKFKVNTGKEGRVFGSISSKQISEELNKKDIKIDKKLITANNINCLGTHYVTIDLHKKVKAELKVTLLGGE